MNGSAENPQRDGLAPHLLCRREDLADIVLLPGDPGRVQMFLELCDDFHIVASNREYTVGTGYYRDTKVSVCSTGIGGPSVEIAVVELVELGVKALMRIGGTGVLREEIACGDMVINTAAMRMGGASNFYAPPEYPAAASFEAVHCLVDACRAEGVNYWKGYSASVGSFFAGQGRPAAGRQFYDDALIHRYETMGILNLEMESETILTLGSLLGVYAGSICAVHANRSTDEWMYDFAAAQKRMCRIALEACCLMEERYL